MVPKIVIIENNKKIIQLVTSASIENIKKAVPLIMN